MPSDSTQSSISSDQIYTQPGERQRDYDERREEIYSSKSTCRPSGDGLHADFFPLLPMSRILTNTSTNFKFIHLTAGRVLLQPSCLVLGRRVELVLIHLHHDFYRFLYCCFVSFLFLLYIFNIGCKLPFSGCLRGDRLMPFTSIGFLKTSISGKVSR